MAEDGVGISIDRLPRVTCEHCGKPIDTQGVEPFSQIACPHCGTTSLVPGRLGPFLLVRLISTGGMGGVYHALDAALGRQVAIKVMRRSLGEDPDFVQRFRQEAQAAARLNHPNIAQIYSFGEEHGQPYIVMELVSGKGFDRLIGPGKPLDQELVIRIALDILEGLKAADEIGLVHGDIKPENILLDEKMKAKLVDFGIAQYAGKCGETGVWGTPYYIAPEKVQRRRSDARSDIYSLGASLFHALAGVAPFEGATPLDVVKARLDKPAPDIRLCRADINPKLAEVITRMLDPSPAMRHPTYASLISDMQKALEAAVPGASLRGEGPGRGRKVVVRRRGERGPDEAPAEKPPGAAAVTVDRASGLSKYRQPALASMGDVKPPRRGGRRAVKGILWLLFLGALASGGGVLYIRQQEKKQAAIAARRERLALEDARAAAETAFRAVSVAATNTLKLAAGVDPPVNRVRQAASAILGEALSRYDVAPRLPPEPVPAATNAAPQAGAVSNAPALPPGEAAPDRTETNADEPDIVGLLREAQTAQALVQRHAAAAARMAAEAQAARDQALQAQTADGVAERAAGLQPAAAAVEALKSAVARAVAQARDLAEKAATLEQKHRAGLEAQRQQEETRRREEARKAQIARELERVATVRAEAVGLVKQHQLDKALALVERERDALATDDAKEAIAWVVDRYTYLRDLRTFLIAALKRESFRWGWEGREDIVGADPTGIRVTTRHVPWGDISLPQLARIIEHCLARSGVAPRVRAERYLGAAVLCSDLDAREAALTYRKKAQNVFPECVDEAGRILPELNTE